MNKKYKVYIHIFPNNKVYVGITSQNTNIRWRKNGSGYGKNQRKIYNAIQKYGWDNIEHKILYENLTKEKKKKKEVELISQYNSTNNKYGYNIANGGHINCVSEETKQKLSEANKGKIAWNKGVDMGEEFRKKCSEAKKGKGLNENLLKTIRKPVLCIETNKTYESLLLASKKTKINVSNIARVCNGFRKTAGGYHWKYILKEEMNDEMDETK